MAELEPTLLDVLQSYQRTLIAKVQVEEFQSWAGTVEFFHRQIVEQDEIERRYIVAVRARRRIEDAAFKAELDKLERK